MTFQELLQKMNDANEAGHGEKEAGFRLSTWLMIMEHINSLEQNLGITTNELQEKVAAVSDEVKRTEQQIVAEDADKLMF